MSKIKIVVYQEGMEIISQECTSYLMATDGDEIGMKCSIIAKSETNMRHLVAACMASVLGIMLRKGVAEEDIDEFFKRAIDEMLTAEQVRFNEPLQ